MTARTGNQNAITKNELVTEYILAELQVKSFYLTKLLAKHDLNQTAAQPNREISLCHCRARPAESAAQDLQRESVTGDFVVQNISFRSTFLIAIESNIIRDSTSSRSSGFGYVRD